MLPETNTAKKQGLSLFLVISLAAAMALLTWFSVQAKDDPAAQNTGQDVQAIAETSPAALQGTEATSMTLHLPYVLRDYPQPPSIFGVQMGQISDAGGLQQAINAQVKWARGGALHWDEIEPVRTYPPTYLWQNADQKDFINAANSGLEVVAVVNLSPAWALVDKNGPHCGSISDLKAFAEFMNAAVARFSKPPYNVRYWEIGNEPDLDPSLVDDEKLGFGCWGDYDDPYYGGEYYGEMLQYVYPAIKAADPNAQVILGGLLLDCDLRHPDGCKDAIHGAKPSRFLEGVLRSGGGRAFDIVGFHTYSYFGGTGHMGNKKWPGAETTVPEKVDFLRGVLAQYGYGNKPLMNTEAALLCKDEWLGQGCRDQQAVYVPRAYADALVEGLVSQLYFGMINDHWWNTGLLEKDLTPRPSYHTYVVASDYLGTAKYVGPARGYPSGIDGYQFKKLSGRIDLIWSEDTTARPVALPSGASAYDRFGKLIATSGTIWVDYGPVWLVW